MKKLKQIPEFKNEDEEFEFWSTNDSTEYLDPDGWRRVPPPIIAKTDDAVFLTIPHSMTEGIERLSKEKKVSVEVLMRQFVAEGLQHHGLQPSV